MKHYYKYIVAYLFALNLIQMRQVRKLLKAGIEVRDQRDDLAFALREMIEIRDTLSRVLNENDIVVSEFDQVLLESNIAKINSLLKKYEDSEEEIVR